MDESECQFHPGVPIFHEGMKYWSCCNRKTSDFQSFLNQEGCERGAHKWKKDPPKVRREASHFGCVGESLCTFPKYREEQFVAE